MDLFLNNKTALITGASKGIGKAIAEALAQEGCNLALTARSGDMLEDVRATLQKKHNISVEIFPIDLSPILNAEEGVEGVSIASTFWNILLKSFLINLLTFCAIK